jgi:hypothetical protein
LSFLVLTLIAAQIGYPGQYPPGGYPPGSYPPGRYPGGQGPGIPIPRRSKKGSSTDQKTEPLQRITGYVMAVDDKSLEIDASDHRDITLKLDEKTTAPKDLKAGDYVEVDAKQDDKGLYTAATVKQTTPPPGAARRQPAPATTAAGPDEQPQAPEPPTTVVQPNTANDPDEQARPKLKRGIPNHPKRPADDDEPVQQVASNSPPASSVAPAAAAPPSAPQPVAAPQPAAAQPMAALIEKARDAAGNFLTSLPNYVVQEYTTRYVSEGHPVSWRAQDVVSADVVYEDHKERYEKVAINGKPTKKPEESGAWSTGEFGTILEDLFSPATAAKFRFVRTSTAQRREAAMYDFTVEQPRSHWTIQVPGQLTRPAYKGSVWVDKETARVLRIEMQAIEIPKEFPEDTVEAALDYDFVSLGTQKFLLPVRSEVLSCQRGSSVCEKNVIEFRNYKKFTGESNIKFEDK